MSISPDKDRTSEVAASFALKVIRRQPLDYLEAVAGSVGQTFDVHQNQIQQATPYELPLEDQTLDGYPLKLTTEYQAGEDPQTHVANAGLARTLLWYQLHVRLPGPGYLLALLLGGLSLVAGRLGRGGDVPTAVIAGAGLVGLAFLMIPAVTVFYDPRYVLAALPFCCVCGGAATERLLRPGSLVNRSR